MSQENVEIVRKVNGASTGATEMPGSPFKIRGTELRSQAGVDLSPGPSAVTRPLGLFAELWSGPGSKSDYEIV